MKKTKAIKSIELSLIESITSALSTSLKLNETLNNIFIILNQHLNVSRGIVALKEKSNDHLCNEMAYGLSESEKKEELQRVNQVIRKEVLETGNPIIIPNLEFEQKILSKIGMRKTIKNTSYLCLPIQLESEKIGTLGIDCPYIDDEHLEHNVIVLSLLSLLIAQEIKLKELMQEENEQLINENRKLKEKLYKKYSINNIIGNSNSIHDVYKNIQYVSQTNTTVLIQGESGTGKELVAHAIHYKSHNNAENFIKVNCGAIPETLIESELFGYEKGAFTDAQEKKIGKFEAANNGTIFLDEISELPTHLQVKILRAIQEKEIHPIGSNQGIKIKVRIIAATNKDLEQEVKNNQFREDLYYRLNVFPIYIPPLRKRESDILLLAEHFLEKYSKEQNKDITRISSLAINLLSTYHWPGNVRELENCIERATILCQSNSIQANHLPPSLQVKEKNTSHSLEEHIINLEKEVITESLNKNNGNRTKTAKDLQTTTRILNYKIKKLNIIL